jgi:hypothetical protein
MKEFEMLKKLSTIGALAAILAVTPALAQAPAQAPAGGGSEPASSMAQPSPATPGERASTSAAPKADRASLTNELMGKSVWSSDDQELGPVTKINRDADVSRESIEFDIGTFLGMGGKTVEVMSSQFTLNGDRIDLAMTAEEVDALSAVTTQ